MLVQVGSLTLKVIEFVLHDVVELSAIDQGHVMHPVSILIDQRPGESLLTLVHGDVHSPSRFEVVQSRIRGTVGPWSRLLAGCKKYLTRWLPEFPDPWRLDVLEIFSGIGLSIRLGSPVQSQKGFPCEHVKEALGHRQVLIAQIPKELRRGSDIQFAVAAEPVEGRQVEDIAR